MCAHGGARSRRSGEERRVARARAAAGKRTPGDITRRKKRNDETMRGIDINNIAGNCSARGEGTSVTCKVPPRGIPSWGRERRGPVSPSTGWKQATRCMCASRVAGPAGETENCAKIAVKRYRGKKRALAEPGSATQGRRDERPRAPDGRFQRPIRSLPFCRGAKRDDYFDARASRFLRVATFCLFIGTSYLAQRKSHRTKKHVSSRINDSHDAATHSCPSSRIAHLAACLLPLTVLYLIVIFRVSRQRRRRILSMK